MGAPKQKWTQDEEAALKAGVNKHGAGKWRTILKDPEFSNMLRNRSNVDLKDKWRNMSVTAHGLGSREKARIALKNSRQTTKHDAYSEPPQISSQKKSISRLDNLILEAIINLKEPTGSNKTAISSYIEDQYCPPADFKELLSEKLKALTASRRLIKVKHKYRITPTSAYSKEKSSKFLAEGQQEEPRAKIKPLTKSQIDAELAQMRNMSAQEAAAVAARAVAEAEAAMAEAEAAAREAEAAEADAEAAQAFAEAAMLTLKNRNVHKQNMQVTLPAKDRYKA
ncbi:single myb histone 6-like isoform X3 [Zingiber officinale]|uniref:single myb histone 6-like isoform X3 n=1 Tax=Zingiber officinale TaxID=94328 RepID=UPI001C4BB00E|nr:single myb histone 6-like isoform X3 [Zingiber officinale]